MEKPLARHIRLESPSQGTHRLLASFDGAPAEGKRSTVVTITRTGKFNDPRYGEFEITLSMLQSMQRNFAGRVYGQDIFLDVAHEPANGAAAEIKELMVEGNRLRARVEWTDYGIKAVKERGFRYLSAEYHENFQDNESGTQHGPTLLGAGLTVRPVIKRLDPVQLSEASGGVPTFVHPSLLADLLKQLTECHSMWLDKLRKKLQALGLKEETIAKMLASAETAAKALGEDQAQLEALGVAVESNAKLLAERIEAAGGSPVTITLSAPTQPVDVDGAVARALAERDTQARTLAEGRKAKQDKYRAALEEKKFSEDTLRLLSESAALIQADWSDASVQALVDQQIKLGDAMEASRQLAALGHRGPMGTPRISMDSGNTVKKLATDMRRNLREQATGVQLKLAEEGKEPEFVKRYLAEFDAEPRHQAAYDMELKALSGGPVVISDTNLPVSVQREVIREALSDTRILELIDARVEPTQAATHQIPYETRDVSAVKRNGVVFEGQPIPRAGISQAMDTAYIVPMKLAMEHSNEVAFFTRASQLNWDAVGRTIESNATYFRELVARRCMNEWIRNADAFGATASGTDTLTSQVNGTRSLFKTTQWPVVRPFQERNLQGGAIGSVEFPWVVTLGGSPITEYDGTGEQTAGNYFEIVNSNLGTFRIVNQAGVVQTPSNATALVATYYYATNIAKFDLDLGSETKAARMDGLLTTIGARRALLADDRYVKADFLLMCHTLNNDAVAAQTFAANYRREGASATSEGDLASIRGLPAYSTNAPSTDLGDERILIAPRGHLRMRIAKTWSMVQPYQILNSSGVPIGKTGSYGEEYSSLKIPTPVRNRATSVIAYSATARAAI